MKSCRASAGCIGILCLMLLRPVFAAVEDNAILALEPEQGTVVVKTAAGTLEVIRVGDAFPDSEVIVRQVFADKVVAEEVVGGEVPVTQTVWVFKAENPSAGSRVERLLHQIPEYGVLAPLTIDRLGANTAATPGSADQ